MKSGKSENRSVKNTKRRLKQGLITLLKEKPASEITVKELCDLVDINRGTFYYHFTDIFDMLRKIQEDFFIEFYQIINQMNTTALPDREASNMLIKIFSFFDENAELCEVMLGKNGDISFVQRLKKLVDEKCSDAWKEAGSLMDPAEYELFNSFIISGYIGLLETWLKTGRKQLPEEMANFVVKFIVPPAEIHALAKTGDPSERSVNSVIKKGEK